MPKSSSAEPAESLYLARFKDAIEPNERVAVMRSMASEFGLRQVRNVCTEIARDVFAPSMESNYGFIHWRPELDAPYFHEVYTAASSLTAGFTRVSPGELSTCSELDPRTLTVFRVILGYTRDEFADATQAVDPDHRVSKSAITVMEKGGNAKGRSVTCARTIHHVRLPLCTDARGE